MILMQFAPDFAEMLRELSAAGAEFLIVGAHARAAYGEPRVTKDLDIWVRATPENAKRVWTALVRFGAPLQEVAQDDFAMPGITYQMGLPPFRIDILTEITGVTFDDAWSRRTEANFAGATYPVIGKHDFMTNKRAVGRPQDLADLDHLEKSPIQ
jgi:hypothetical protein